MSTERQPDESLDQYFERLREKSDREDLVMFINACFASTRQNEFYTDRFQLSVSIEFLHLYVMANYRRLYARALAAGINHFNQAKIVFNLLKSGAPAETEQRKEEGELIQTAIRNLPANRVYSLLQSLQRGRVNNRRTRAVIKSYLQWRREPEFDAIKYRNKYRAAASHAHLKLPGELGPFLFDLEKQKRFETELLENYRQAHYTATAIYELPFTIAESLAQKHQVPRDVFFRKIEHKMTAAEKMRFQTSARTMGANINFDLKRASLTKLVLYLLSLSEDEQVERAEEFDGALKFAARRACRKSPMKLGRVAAILDQSRSSQGSRQRRNRPLAVAIAARYLLQEVSDELQTFWTPDENTKYDFQRSASGQTSLAEPLIDAFEWHPDMIVIVSDGYENDPPMAANQLAAIYAERIGKENTPEIIHANPVFDADHFSPRPLGTAISTVGLRDAEDLPTMLGFARFANGTSTLSELEQYLEYRVNLLLKGANDD